MENYRCNSTKAVSYTHLDVYKRQYQFHHCNVARYCRTCHGKDGSGNHCQWKTMDSDAYVGHFCLLYTSHKMEKKISLLIWIPMVIIALSLAGFYRSYLSHFPKFSNFDGLIHIHFLAFSGWFALMLVQPILIRKKQFEKHKTCLLYTSRCV